MTPAARSMLVYSIYSFGLGATLLLIPNVPLPLFGLPQATEVWIRVAGMTVIFLATFFYIAAIILLVAMELDELVRADLQRPRDRQVLLPLVAGVIRG